MGGGGGTICLLALRGSVDLTIMDLVANRHLNGQASQPFSPSMGFSLQPVAACFDARKRHIDQYFLYIYYSMS